MLLFFYKCKYFLIVSHLFVWGKLFPFSFRCWGMYIIHSLFVFTMHFKLEKSSTLYWLVSFWIEQISGKNIYMIYRIIVLVESYFSISVVQESFLKNWHVFILQKLRLHWSICILWVLYTGLAFF